MNYERVKVVTVPTLSLQENTIVVVRIDTAMFEGKKLDEDKNPATLAMVTLLESGEQMTMICPAVLESALDEVYPGETYVGRWFEVEKGAKKKGRSGNEYSNVRIIEVSPTTETVTPIETAKPTAKRRG